MPFYIIHKYRIVFADYDNAYKLVWPLLTAKYIQTYDGNWCRAPNEIDTRLKFIVSYLIERFESLVRELPSASFFMFVHLNNDQLTHLYNDQLAGYEINHEILSKDDIALERRVYKVIIEQYVKFHLYHENFIEKDIKDNVDEYEKRLGELLYLGCKIYMIISWIAENNFYPGCLEIGIIENGEFGIKEDSPFRIIHNANLTDLKRHHFNVELRNIVPELRTAIHKSFGVVYGEALGAILYDNAIGDFSYMNLLPHINDIAIQLGCDPIMLKRFFDGLTLSEANALGVEDSFLRSQSNTRFIYRPILELNINGNKVHKLSRVKLNESITTLTTNAIPYGHSPKEWLSFRTYRQFEGKIMNTQDKVLQEPMCLLLNNHGLIFDHSVETLRTTNKSRNINILKDPGEIDIVFIKDNIVGVGITMFICECKNNRLRTDMQSWARDYSNFKESYEQQLDRKVNWARQNTSELLTHLELKKGLEMGFLTGKHCYVSGLFLINPPTLYMYDGLYEVFTMTSFEEFLKGNFTRITFDLEDEETGKHVLVSYPYYRNLKVLPII